MTNNRIALVASSCDFFEDCWAPLILSIKKYWGEISFPAYIISNEKEIEDDKVKFLKIGEDKGWPLNLKNALERLDTEYVLYMHEDMWFCDHIDNEKILSHLDYCDKNQIDYLRLTQPFFDKYKKNEMYAYSPVKSERYALNLQPAIWRRSALLKLLFDGWTAWDFERKVCQYIIENKIKMDSMVMMSTAPKEYHLHCVDATGVRKGRWTEAGYKFLKDHGFENILSKRPKEGKWINRLSIWRRNPLLWIPASATIRLLNKYKINI